MKRDPVILALGAALVLALSLSGCVSRPAPTTVYVLEPLPQTRMTQKTRLPGLVLVMPVRLPPQLRQKSIVVEEAEGPKVLVGHLWAGPLDEQIGANLAADLQQLLGSADVALYPGPRYSRARYQVETELTRFSGDDRLFTLQGVVTVSDPGERRILSRQSFTRTAPVEGRGYSAYVTAASQTVGALSREIAATLAELARNSR